MRGQSQSPQCEGLPAEVLDDVASVVGAEVTGLGRLPGGINSGALRVQLAGRADAVLKAVPRAHVDQLDETLRARRVVEHMCGRGYPTPAWLGAGATATHVWHLMDFVDAAPVSEPTPAIVEQLMEIIELQAGQAREPHDHWSYAWRVTTGQEPAVAGLSGYSSAVSDLVERLRLAGADLPPPPGARTWCTPTSARAMSWSVTGQWWHSWTSRTPAAAPGRPISPLSPGTPFQDPLDGVRSRLWTRILDLVGWEGAVMLATAQILLQLVWPIRLGRDDVVAGVVERGHRALDELSALR